MRVIDRYLIKGFLGPLIFCVLLFTTLFVVVDSFNNLDEYLKYNVPVNIILTYYLYLSPTLLVQIVPVSALVAILFLLGNLNKHNEIIAFKASGISSFQLLSPYLFIGLLISFSIFLLSETVIPDAMVTSRAIFDGLILKGKKSLNERAIKNVTLYGEGNRMIYAREYEILSRSLHDVIILENDANTQILKSKLIAKKAQYDAGRWIFHDVMTYKVDRRGEILGEPLYAEKLTLELTEKPEDFIKEASQVEFMSARQLKVYIENLKGTSKKLIRRLWVDFHYKIAFPFVSFIVMLIGAPLAMRTERGSAMLGIGTSLIVVILYYGIDSVCLALGKGGYLPPFVAAWFSNICFSIVGIYLIRKTA